MAASDKINNPKYPLYPLVKGWAEKLRLAKDFKKKLFQDDADEAMKFFHCGRELSDLIFKRHQLLAKLPQDDEEDFPAPRFRVVVGKVAELVELFGPTLYHRNPIVNVEPKDLDIPTDLLMQLVPPEMVQQAQMAAQQQGQQFDPKTLFPPDPQTAQDKVTAILLQYYLNYIQNENDKKKHSRRMIDEALIKGRGCLAGGTRLYTRDSESGETSVRRIRDVYKKWDTTELWDGTKWVRVVAMIRHERKGDERKLTLRSGEEIHCTPDHKWPTSRGVLRADQLTIGDCIQSTILPEPSSESPEHLPDGDIGWFIGLFLAEGHVDGPKRDSHIGIALHEDEKDIHDRLTRIVRAYGGAITWRGREGTKCWNATIYSRVLAAVLREFVAGDGAYGKHLSARCWSKSTAFLSAIMDGYLDGDGHFVDGEDIWRLGFCENDDLAASIRTLSARLGCILTLKKYTGKNGFCEKYTYYKGSIRRGDARNPAALRNRCEIIDIGDADWRCDYFYDLNVECEPRLFALATGTLSHNCLWTEMFSPFDGGPQLIGSFYDTIDNVLLDPDADHLDEVKWIARRCIHPVQDVAKEYDLDEKWLREKFGTDESLASQGESVSNEKMSRDRKIGKTNDLIEYWKIYSRMGMGHKLAGMEDSMRNLEEFLDSFGENCYIVIQEDISFPLNLKTKDIQALNELEDEEFGQAHQELVQQVAWPIPFWADGEWPCTFLDFHEVPNSTWPMPHIKPGMGYLKFINWTMSFLTNKMRTSCRNVCAIPQAVAEEFKQQIFAGKDWAILEVPSSVDPTGDISKIVHWLNVPPVNQDIWKVIEAVFDLFDKATGLTELAYGAPGGMRSAAEAQGKMAAQNVRPDDMANKVEDTMSLIARKEAMAARWLLDGQAVSPVLGKRGASLWQQFVMSGDILKVSREYNYRIEAGSMRKPNKDTEIQNFNQTLQVWAPLIQFCLAQHQWTVVNALITQYGKVFDYDVSQMLLPPPPPPPPNPMQQKVEAEIEQGKQELQMKQQESQIKQQGIQADLQAKQQKNQIEIAGIQAKSQAEAQKSQIEMQMDAARMQQEALMDRAKMQHEMQADKMRLGQEMAAQRMGLIGDTLRSSLEMRMAHEKHKHALAQPQETAK